MTPIAPHFRFRRRSVTPRSRTRRHLLAEVTSETLDGVTARVLVEFTRDTLLPESLPETSDGIALDAVETALRTYVASLPSPALPSPGQRLGDLEELLETQEVIDNVFMITCDLAPARKAAELASR